jgi:hypothetical protein
MMIAGAAAAVAGAAVIATRSWDSAWDRLEPRIERMEVDPRGAAEGRPGRYVHHGALMRRVANPIMVATGIGITVLYVRGRRSGRRLPVPMDPPFEWQGTRYLVSPLGDTHWARNLRAAGEGQLRSDGRLVRFRAVELRGADRDAIVTAYANTITCGCREYLKMLPDPADHPVFRIESPP